MPLSLLRRNCFLLGVWFAMKDHLRLVSLIVYRLLCTSLMHLAMVIEKTTITHSKSDPESRIVLQVQDYYLLVFLVKLGSYLEAISSTTVFSQQGTT